MKLKDELRLWKRQDGTWAQACKDGRRGVDLDTATVSLWSHPGGRLAAIVSVKAGTNFFTDSLNFTLQGEAGPRMVEALRGIADLDREVLEWVIDRLDATTAVAATLLLPLEEACDGV